MQKALIFSLAFCSLLLAGCETLTNMVLGNCGPGVYSSMAETADGYAKVNREAGTSAGESFWAGERKFYCDQKMSQ